MTFVRKKNKTFKWPVVVREPSETDAGAYEENEFIGIFQRLKTSTYLDAIENKDEFEMLKMILVGWENMKEEDGEDIIFNDKNIKELMEDSFWVKAVSETYTQALRDEKVKN